MRFIMLALIDDLRSNPEVRLLHVINSVTAMAIPTIGMTIHGTMFATSTSVKVNKTITFSLPKQSSNFKALIYHLLTQAK